MAAVFHLLTGTSASVVLSLVSIALAARSLGPQDYGVLALILTLGQACERLLSFQSWQPIIRYGAPLDEIERRDDLRSLYKYGLALDCAGSSAAWAMASLLAILGHFVLNISWPHVALALLFMVSLLFNFNGTATAVFRLSDRFRVYARLQIITSLARLLASGLAFYAGAGLLGWILVWLLTQILGSMLNILVSIAILHRRGLRRIWSARLRGITARFPDIWRFTWGANVSLTIWSSAQQLDTLVVGWLVDPAAAGMYQLTKKVSRVVQQVGSQVEAVVYPDLSRMWAAGQRSKFIGLILRMELVLASFGGLCCVGAFLLGHYAISATAGAKFVAAAPLLTVQIFAVSLTISGAASRAGLLSMGLQPAVLRTVLASTLAFYLMVAPLIELFGAMGANIAQVMFGMIWLGGLSLALRRGLKQARPAPAPALAVADA
ncbi:lipopolysaccharide biosynthesis protein [Flavisphingomonas formosensis]|uniref:lipopolysaccharide biosynthesis protein n=1 Tax=Flavisphingomonas formosensis TaxID=861534 RepID=UPI001E3602A6|nr:lipopolysaccharide biosynthesis protein [Sphingomonas formosensis]